MRNIRRSLDSALACQRASTSVDAAVHDNDMYLRSCAVDSVNWVWPGAN